MKSAALLILLLILAAPPAAAQPAPRASFDLKQPENNAKVGNPAVVFSWAYPEGAAQFKFTLKRVDLAQSITLVRDATICYMLQCAFTFDPAVYSWVWKKNALYTWRVKASDAEGDSLGKSKQWSFTAKMMPKIAIEAPVDGQTVTLCDCAPVPGIYGFNTDISAPVERPMRYVVTLTAMDGSYTFTSIAEYTCADTCRLYVIPDVAPGELKTFYLRAVGTDPSVIGKSKSPKLRIKAYRPA